MRQAICALKRQLRFKAIRAARQRLICRAICAAA